MKWINRLYVLFLGIILSITTGFGVAAFYPQPVRPDSSLTYRDTVPQSCYSTPQAQSSLDCQNLIQQRRVVQQQYESDLQTYQNKNSGYTRTAIFFGIAIGAIYAIIGLGLIKKSKLVATGLLLAGILTAILTRMLIGLASLGASVTGTSSANLIVYMEFGILLILSVVVIMVGLYSLKEVESITPTSPQPTQRTLT